jgi:hypothetical protein
MTSLVGRLRSWVNSVEFAVTGAAIAVALASMPFAFQLWEGSVDGYFVVILAGVTAPSIYENQWPRAYERRLVGAAWAVGAAVALVACYVLVAGTFKTVLGGVAPSAAAFAVSWFLGMVAARVYEQAAA